MIRKNSRYSYLTFPISILQVRYNYILIFSINFSKTVSVKDQ